MYTLYCVAPDGAYQTEGPFKTVNEAWEYANDLGSKWFFYPYRGVSSGKKVIKELYTEDGVVKNYKIGSVLFLEE